MSKEESVLSKKIGAVTDVAASLSSAAIVSATPAAAISDSETAAIASGAMNGGAYREPVVYQECSSARRPIYDHLGDVIGFRWGGY